MEYVNYLGSLQNYLDSYLTLCCQNDWKQNNAGTLLLPKHNIYCKIGCIDWWEIDEIDVAIDQQITQSNS